MLGYDDAKIVPAPISGCRRPARRIVSTNASNAAWSGSGATCAPTTTRRCIMPLHCRQVWCVFVFDREILDPLLERGLQADRRVDFILRSLAPLHAALSQWGGGLIVLDAMAREAIPQLAAALEAEAVFANHDYEPVRQRPRCRRARCAGRRLPPAVHLQGSGHLRGRRGPERPGRAVRRVHALQERVAAHGAAVRPAPLSCG